MDFSDFAFNINFKPARQVKTQSLDLHLNCCSNIMFNIPSWHGIFLQYILFFLSREKMDSPFRMIFWSSRLDCHAPEDIWILTQEQEEACWPEDIWILEARARRIEASWTGRNWRYYLPTTSPPLRQQQDPTYRSQQALHSITKWVTAPDRDCPAS